jgi:hypothetical protein
MLLHLRFRFAGRRVGMSVGQHDIMSVVVFSDEHPRKPHTSRWNHASTFYGTRYKTTSGLARVTFNVLAGVIRSWSMCPLFLFAELSYPAGAYV